MVRKTGAADLEAMNPEDSAFDSVYPFEALLAGSKRTSDGQLKAPSAVSIRRGCTKVLSVVVNVVEGKIPVATELDCADTMPPQGNSSESHVCERVIPDIEQVALYFDNLMITKSPNEYYAEKIIRDMNMPGSAEYHNVLDGFFLHMQEISANGGHATPQSDELTSKLVRCLLAAYEQVSEGGEIRVWNLLEGIAQNANKSEYARYHAALRDLYLHIRQNAANAGIEAAQVDDVITSKLVHDFLAAYEQISHGGSTTVWQILENAVHDIRSLNSDQQSPPAGEFANFGYDPSQSTAPTGGFDELVVCDSVMYESTPMVLGGGNTVHSVDQVLPTQNKTPKTSVPASAQSLPHGQPSTNLFALRHYAHSAADPSR
ncbi:hypothetical protein DL95DRAFT_470198 [Leptodontidium sp. 2 PMI_412]|nr:hypothetical protein DL95DRAFT_470198 [Leptodontidium sp. 2 PMI_412]